MIENSNDDKDVYVELTRIVVISKSLSILPLDYLICKEN